MTFLELKIVECAVCGATKNVTSMASSNSFGLCDLDFRPAEMMRSDMVNMLSFCSSCGYANSSLEKLNYPNAKELVESNAYQKMARSPELAFSRAKAFFLLAVLQRENKDYKLASYNYLRAAWFFDDEIKIELAKLCRELSISCFEKVKNLTVGDNLVYIDMKRRIGCFDGALKTINALLKKDDLDKEYIDILNIQKDLCEKNDIACYCCDGSLRHNSFDTNREELFEIDPFYEEIENIKRKMTPEEIKEYKLKKEEKLKELKRQNEQFYEELYELYKKPYTKEIREMIITTKEKIRKNKDQMNNIDRTILLDNK